MTQETLIFKTNLCNLFSPFMIEHLVRDGYRKTGNKFSLNFNGSKGYLDNISIECEGYQKEQNRIDRTELFTKNGYVKKKVLNVYHSCKNGVRLSFGTDKPRVIRPEPKLEEATSSQTDTDDLPF